MKKSIPYLKRAVATSKGFTLVETLVAIAILVTAVTGAFTAAQGGIISSTYSKNQVIAFYLAAEGMEEIRNIRDTNGITHPAAGWLKDVASQPSDPCYFGKVCTVDAVNSSGSLPVLATCNGTCPVLKLDPVNGFYGYTNGWTNTIFRREISITQINAHEVSILVSVIWKKGLVDRKFDIRENIFDWQ